MSEHKQSPVRHEFPSTMYQSARDFLRALDLANEQWTRNVRLPQAWVFRGHADSRWPLMPAAWRENAAIPSLDQGEAEQLLSVQMEDMIHPRDTDFHKESLLYTVREIRAVEQFYNLASRIGIPVPSTAMLSSHLFAKHNGATGDFDNYSATELVALAQHHGIPTRLLDTTWQPRVAAYFAGYDVIRRKHNTDSDACMCVWAIHRLTSHFTDLQILTFPRTPMSFLGAQDGAFVWHPRANSFYIEHGRWPSFEECFTRGKGEHSFKGIRRLDLPHSEVPAMMDLLAAMGITLAHLMPTLDNVAQTVRLRYST